MSEPPRTSVNPGGVFLLAAIALIIAGAVLASALWSGGVDLNEPPAWAVMASGLYLGVLAGACGWFITMIAPPALAGKGRAHGRDGVVVALILSVIAGVWSTRGVLSIMAGEPLSKALVWTDPRGGLAVERVGDRVRVRGEVTGYMTKAIAGALGEAPGVTELEIFSSGGSVSAAAEIAQLVQARSLDVVVTAGCGSACLDIFLAGARRVLGPDGVLACHQASDVFSGRTVGASNAFRAVNPPPEAAETWVQLNLTCDRTPPERMHVPTLQTLADVEAVTHVGSGGADMTPAKAYCAAAPERCAVRQTRVGLPR